MKKILFVSIVLLLNVLTVAAQPQPLSDYEVTKIIEQTIQDIKDALKEIKPQFPQLANIDYAATITRNPSGEDGIVRLEYKKGFVQGSQIPKDATSIFVEIKYPAALEDVRAREQEGKLFMLGNGNPCVYWKSVMAEDSEQGKAFKNKAEEIIALKLLAMQIKLK